MRFIMAVLALGFTACGGSTDPGDQVPRLLVYDYEFSTPSLPGAPAAVQCLGTFTVTYATADSIAGRWEVPACKYRVSQQPAYGYQQQPLFGKWNGTGYYLWARPTTGGQHVHTFARESGYLRCVDGRNVYGTSSGSVAAVVADVCTLIPRE